ncbi:MAG: FkbM family methyltransferase [Halioglobus sp.]
MADEALIALQVADLPHALDMFVHGAQDQFVSRQLREEGIWEPYETTLLLSLLRQGDVFVDVGANIGYFSLLAAARVGEEGAVIAIEPDPENCRLLRQSLKHNGLASRVQLVEGALSDADGAGELYLSEDNLGDHQIYSDGTGRSAVSIALYNGSDLLAPLTPRIDVMKVDTQGSEWQVMQGIAPLLERQDTTPHIMIELTPFSLAQAGSSGRELIELLDALCESMWIIDHVEHRLVPCEAEALAVWCDNVAATPGDRGFMNILAGPPLG